MFDKMPPFMNLIKQISVIDWPPLVYNPRNSDFDQAWSASRSIKERSSCYSFIYKGNKFDKKNVINNQFIPYLYEILFENDHNFTRDKIAFVYLHSRNVLNSAQDNSYLEIAMNDTISEIFLTYDLYRNELLEWPYRTKCRHYNKTSNFRTQGHCIDHCRFVSYHKKLQIFSSQILIEENDHYPKEIRFDELIEYNETIKNICLDIENFCVNYSCANEDCIREEFIPSVRKVDVGQNLTFALGPPRGPDFNVKCVPAISLIDFVTYVLSTIGFWTGFAPLTLAIIKVPKSLRLRQLLKLIRTIQLTNDLERQQLREQIKNIVNRNNLLEK